MRALWLWIWRLIATLFRLAPPDPGEGERIPGTDYIRCGADCRAAKVAGRDNTFTCVPDDTKGKTPCKPNDPEQYKERCRCVGFQKKPGGEWEEMPKEWRKDDDVRQVCWCVRPKKK